MKVRKMSIVGVDEAGRGPIAGPVAVGVFYHVKYYVKHRMSNKYVKHPMFNMGELFGRKGIRDSKKMTEREREEMYLKIVDLKKNGQARFAVSFVSAKVIDRIGISRATARAVARALLKLKLNQQKTKIKLDGLLKAPAEFKNQETIIKGDEKVPEIALASIVAKVSRDRLMKRLSIKYPRYSLDIHKGYGTYLHREKIKKYGLSPLHRRTFIKI